MLDIFWHHFTFVFVFVRELFFVKKGGADISGKPGWEPWGPLKDYNKIVNLSYVEQLQYLNLINTLNQERDHKRNCRGKPGRAEPWGPTSG